MAEQVNQRPAEKKAPVKNGKRKKRRLKRFMMLTIVLAVCLAGGLYIRKQSMEAKRTSAQSEENRTAKVEKRDITSQLSSSGTLAPKDTYEITSLAEGEVILADFEEGDQVEKGQILYQLDASSVESEVQSANHSLTRAQGSYADALSDYQEVIA